MVVHKFKLKSGENIIPLEASATPLCVNVQGNDFCMWVCRDQAAMSQPITNKRIFALFCTGEEVNHPGTRKNYVGTIFTPGAEYVFHVFELAEAGRI